MIILQNGEQLVRKDGVELFSDETKFGKGTLYLTNTRLMFETESGMVPRLIALHTIQSVVPVKKHEFTVSYMNDDGTRIFTDRYKIRDRGKCEDWLRDFQKVHNIAILSDSELIYSKPLTESARNRPNYWQSDNRDENNIVTDLNTTTLSWKRVEGWREFPREHVWQGRNRIDLMNKKEWLAYKHEANALEEMLLSLYNNYCEFKTKRNIDKCREIRKAMRIVDKELFGKGEIPYKDVEADEIADTGSFSR